MRMSAELYRQVVESLTADPPHPLAREKRSEPRAGVRSKATVVLPDATGPADGNPGGALTRTVPLRDLSQNGIGLLTNTPVTAGAQFVLVLPESAGGGGMALLFSVVYCRQLASDLFSVGGRLVRLPIPVDQLVSWADAGSSGES